MHYYVVGVNGSGKTTVLLPYKIIENQNNKLDQATVEFIGFNLDLSSRT